MKTATVTLEDMRSIDLFDDLSDAELAEWVAVAVPDEAVPGDTICEAGLPPRGAIMTFEGSMEAINPDGNGTGFGLHVGPTWGMAIATMTGTEAPVRMQAATDCRFAWIESEDFQRLSFEHRSVHDKVIRQMQPVYQRMAQNEQNRERMAALGTMSAGLAHELNNPAAAANRAATELDKVIEVISSALKGFVEAGVSRENAAGLVELQQQAFHKATQACAVDTLAAADAEDELLDRLEEMGVDHAWKLAEPLSQAMVDDAWLKRLTELAGPATGIALDWVAATLVARGLASELQDATGQISELVGVIKSYSFMDRGEMVEADLHEGIASTFRILKHKYKKLDIEKEVEFAEGMPPIMVRGSELNQVWTNLLDNAIDAAGEGGRISLRTWFDGTCVQVDLTDDGPGIPEDVQGRIFDDFFTTKDVGEGTGLGLATARRIVSEHHDGSIWVDSVPGETTFHVRLPYKRSQ
ncbi:MAG TPA: ATP-binding protein [Solirubrobacterales bacterium]|nr:ATP-binding protein [Solirubrobacterales bacterium]